MPKTTAPDDRTSIDATGVSADSALISRRKLLGGSLVLGAGIATGVASTSAFAASEPVGHASPIQSPDLSENDGLAHPIPYRPQPGLGKERGLALGGGGVYLLSWMMGYFQALRQSGVDLDTADIVVGTSAGSVAGTMLTSGKLWRLDDELGILKTFPKLFAELLPPVQPNISQLRARKVAGSVKDASPQSIQAIGRAAMAANNPDGPDKWHKAIHTLIGQSDWPSDRLHTTANDCYTGERLVVSANSGIPIDVACGASSSLPGGTGPTWLKDRLCMDGGICQTSTHADVVAGVKRALIISLTDGNANAVKSGLRVASTPNTLQAEVKALEANGTKVKLVVCGMLPGVSHVGSLLDPSWVTPLMNYGRQRGLAEAREIAAFWN